MMNAASDWISDGQSWPMLRALMAHAPFGLGFWDRNLRCICVNETLAAIDGIPAETHVGRTLADVCPSLADAFGPVLRGVLDTGESCMDLEVTGARPGSPDGQRQWRVNCFPIRDNEDGIVAVGCSVTEITERGQATANDAHRAAIVNSTQDAVVGMSVMARDNEDYGRAGEALRRSEERYRGLIEDQPDLVTRILPDGTLTFVNRSCATYYGAEPDDLLGGNVLAMVPPDEAAAIRVAFDGMSPDAPLRTTVQAIPAKDGAMRWLQWTNRGIFDQDGRLAEVQGVGRDITEQKIAEEALRESEERLRVIADVISDAIWDWDIRSDALWWGDGLRTAFGHEPAVQDPTIASWHRRIHPDDRERVVAGIRGVIDGEGSEWSDEYRYARVDGTYADVVDRGRVFREPDGTPIRMVGGMVDLTEQKRTAHDLSRYRLLAEHMTDIMLFVNLDGQIIGANQSAVAAYGYERDELLALTIFDLRGGALSEEAHQGVVATAIRGITFESLHCRKDGTKFPVEATVASAELDGEQVLLCVARDISERQRVEAALLEREQDMRVAVETARLGTWSLDLATGEFRGSARAMEIYGTGPEPERHLTLSTFSELIHPDDRAIVDESTARVLREAGVYENRYRIVLPDGTIRWIVASGRTIAGADGHPMRAVGVAMDVTESQVAEEERTRLLEAERTARAEAEEASRAKSAFLAMMSHEIRTPLNGVIGMTSLLLDSALDAEQREYAATIRSSGESLLQIINDILDFSKIEAERLVLEVAPCDPRMVVEDVAGLLARHAAASRIEFATLVDIPDNLRFLGDAGRIRQVLLNLAGNAIKFTSVGAVTIRAYLVDDADEDDQAVVRFDVTDTGVGIAPDVIARLFQPFVQADSSTTRQYGGTGLGLAISKRLTTVLGGEIGVRSEVGTGSTFWFTVRLAHDRAAEADVTLSQMIRGRRILLISDSATSRQMLRDQLESWGVAVVTAPTASVTVLRRSGRVDAIILDMQATDDDGQAAIRAIRAEAGLAVVKILLITLPGQTPAEAAAATVDARLTRPVRPSQLHDRLQDLLFDGVLRSTPAPAPETHAGDHHGHDHMRVLIAEDNVVNQKVAGRMLEKLHYRVDLVANGREAVEALRRFPYAAVLMDCQMPEMDGYEATALIRRAEGGERRTPIIAMTASAMQGDREQCLAAGMDDYISKPVRQGDLAAALERWISIGRPVR